MSATGQERTIANYLKQPFDRPHIHIENQARLRKAMKESVRTNCH
jgi:hypothetical protein